MKERRFFGQRVDVVCERDAAGFRFPSRFTLDKEELKVAEILRRWHDHGFHTQTRRRIWLDRRHRTYYRVRANDGHVYDLYVDRTGGRRDWFLTRKASAPERQGGSGEKGASGPSHSDTPNDNHS